MRKIIAVIVLFCIALSAFTGCKLSISKSEEDTAAGNAIAYIEDKYGFTPKVTDVSSNITSGALFPSLSRFATVTLRYEGDEFEVRVLWGEDTTDDASDNYMWDEFSERIKSDVEDRLDCEDYRINVEIPFLDMRVTNYKELLKSDYRVVINVLSYGLTRSCFEGFDNDFLGENFWLILRDYKLNDFPEWEQINNTLIANYEFIDLNYSIHVSEGDCDRHDYESVQLNGMTAVYDAADDVRFEVKDADYSFIETHDNYGYDYPFDAYHVTATADSRIYLYIDHREPHDGYSKSIFDGYYINSDGASYRDISVEIDSGAHQGRHVITIRPGDAEFDYYLIQRSYS